MQTTDQEDASYKAAFDKGAALIKIKGSIQLDGQRLKSIGFFERRRLNIYGAILWWLLSGARRDRIFDRTLAVGGLVLSLLPFAGAAVAALFSLWLSWDLRRV